MLSATSSNSGIMADNHAEQSAFPRLSTSYLCTSCQISFQNGQQQRVHMKEPWHVCNIKRRIASLPPVPLDAFDIPIKKKIDISKAFTSSRSDSSRSDESTSDKESEQSASPFQCLFCNQGFATDDAGFAMNLDHMCTAHGMSIPDPEMVIDMQSFVGYLATEIRAWHECLYCGATKPSTRSIQSHMRDKGHCLLNLDREPELLDFWDRPRCVDGVEVEVDGVGGGGTAAPEPKRLTNLSATEIRFASGKVVGSRFAASVPRKRVGRRVAASTLSALPSGSDVAESSSPTIELQLALGRQLARHDEMSMQGVSVQQRRSLVLAEKKAQRSDAVARQAREWKFAKGANSQKYDQVDNQMKFGKQNHKLLPR